MAAHFILLLALLPASLCAISSTRPARALARLRGGGDERKPILVVGSLNVDIIIEVPRLPKRDETIAARNDNTGRAVTGGKGANQAVAAARLVSASRPGALTGARTHARLDTTVGR